MPRSFVAACLVTLFCILQQGCTPPSAASAGPAPGNTTIGRGGAWTDVARRSAAIAAAEWALDLAPFASEVQAAEMQRVWYDLVADGRRPEAFFLITNVLAPSSDDHQWSTFIRLPRGAVAAVQRTDRYHDPELGETWVWTGTLYGSLSSFVSLTADRRGVSGTIEADDALFSIQQVGDSLHVLVHEPTQGNPPEGPPRTPPDTTHPDRPSISADPITAAGDPQPPCPPAQVDVLVVYTPRVERHYGTREGVIRAVREAERRTNVALDSSRVVHRIRVISIEPARQESSGYLGTDLSALDSVGDNIWDEVHLRRAQLRADIISLWTPRAHDYCGLGYKILKPAAHGRWGMHTVSVSCEHPGRYTFSHELGHNFGMEHNRLAAGGKPGVHLYSFGFRSPDGRLLSLESLNCAEGQTCPDPIRQLIYSTPRVKIGPIAMGIEHYEDPVNSADNARSAVETMCFAARWGEALN